jgi:hypothetical protein
MVSYRSDPRRVPTYAGNESRQHPYPLRHPFEDWRNASRIEWSALHAITVMIVGKLGTQDLVALDIDLAAITQAGGWKSTRMPLQYAETINAARSGMARSAAAAGRDETVTK